MASVESIEGELQSDTSDKGVAIVPRDALAAEDASQDHDMIEATHLLTNGFNIAQSGPSDAETEGSTETDLTEQPLYHDGDRYVRPIRAMIEPEDAEVEPGNDQSNSPIGDAQSISLCEEYMLDNPLTSACIPTPPKTLADDLADPPEVQSIALLAAPGVLNGTNAYEKWDVDRDSAGFLASVLALGRGDGSPRQLEDGYISFSDLKLMEPLLHVDPQLDMQQLKRRNRVTISARGIKEIPLSTGKDKSVEWPPKSLDLLMQMEGKIASDKMEVSKDVMEYLRAIADPPRLSYTEMMDILIDSDKILFPKPYTPPLMPLSAPFSPAALPEPMQEIELTSTPEDLLANEAAQVDRDIMAMDEVTANSSLARQAPRATVVDATELYSGLRTPEDSSSSPLRRKRLRDLKADVPLMPLAHAEPPAKKAKTLSFPEEVQPLIPQPVSDLSIMDPNVAQQDLDAFVNDVVMPFAESALQQTENEQLVEIDTTMRLNVPQITNAAAKSPWKVYSIGNKGELELSSQRALMSLTKRELLKTETNWSGVSKLERMLAWSPFPARLGKLKLDDDFDDDKSSERYLAQLAPEGDIDVQDLVSKIGSLRLLDAHDSDDEDLEAVASDGDEEVPEDSAPAEANLLVQAFCVQAIPNPYGTLHAAPTRTEPGRLDMQTLLQRRKLELEYASNADKHTDVDIEHAVVESKDDQKQRTADTLFKPSRPVDLLKDGGIKSFMRLQGASSKPLTASPGHGQPTAPAAIMVPQPEILKPSVSELRRLPAPNIVQPERAIQVVISTHLLADRTFVRQLHALLPALDLVEREHIAGGKVRSNLHQQQDSVDTDITISPILGLCTTNVQKLKQKPLPGHTSFFGIRERIAAVSQRYERLVVLVGEGKQNAAGGHAQAQPLDERDCDALSELMAFVAVLEAEVRVQYVPGGQDEMVKWIAAAVSQHCVSGEDIKLLPEETLWERFLRTAGMNAFAAQTTLGKLKQPDAIPHDASSSTLHSSQAGVFGLAAFVRMSVEQRIQQFGPVLGGETVLRQVSELIDCGWASASGPK